MEVSVVIPTYNRLQTLGDTLDSLVRQEFDEKEFEIIVVDNHPTIKAYELVNAYRIKNRSHKIIYIETTEGVNRARNVGISTAKGKIAAFCDDDTIEDSKWLYNIKRSLKMYPKFDVIGGRVLPKWERKKPEWIPKILETYLAILDFGDKAVENPQWLVGANMAIKKSAFRKYGKFNEELGRYKGHNFYKDEIEFLDRVRDKGGKMLYEPKMLVQHKIAPDRLSLVGITRRAIWEGRSEAKYIRMFGGRRWYVRNLVSIAVQFGATLLHVVIWQPKKIAEHYINFCFYVGYVYQVVCK